MGIENKKQISLYGDINEQNINKLIIDMSTLATPNKDIIEFFINTKGGSSNDMFSLYDMMRKIKETNEIHTIGLGRVWSAGVLLLAAGTKGCRSAGRNCQIIIHSAQTTFNGSVARGRRHLEELSLMDEKNIKALVEETKLKREDMLELFQQSDEILFTSEEAVEWGIIDYVF